MENKWDETLSIFDKIAQKNGFSRKGKSVPYISANGHMFALMNKDGDLGMRYSKEKQAEYFTTFKTSYLISHGAKMNGYIRITDEMLHDTDLLSSLLKESFDYVMTLPKK